MKKKSDFPKIAVNQTVTTFSWNFSFVLFFFNFLVFKRPNSHLKRMSICSLSKSCFSNYSLRGKKLKRFMPQRLTSVIRDPSKSFFVTSSERINFFSKVSKSVWWRSSNCSSQFPISVVKTKLKQKTELQQIPTGTEQSYLMKFYIFF